MSVCWCGYILYLAYGNTMLLLKFDRPTPMGRAMLDQGVGKLLATLWFYSRFTVSLHIAIILLHRT